MAPLGNEIALPWEAALFLGAALALAASPAKAQTLVLHDGDRPHVLGEVATVLVDPCGKLSPSQLLAPENIPRFKPVGSRHPGSCQLCRSAAARDRRVRETVSRRADVAP